MDARSTISTFRNRAYWITTFLILLSTFSVLSGTASPLRAATFRAISADAIAASSPYRLNDPAIEVTALSGDGNTIAGHLYDPGVIYDCARNDCGVTPFRWSLGDGPYKSHFTTPMPINSTHDRYDLYPVFATALNHFGDIALVISEYRHYESAIYTDGEPRWLRDTATPNENLLAIAMSPDGNVVAGNLGSIPFRWDETTGVRIIHGLPEPYLFTATSLSANGRQLLLNAEPWPGPEPHQLSPRGNSFTWNEQQGLRELVQLIGDTYAHGTSISADGHTVVGDSVRVTSDRVHLSRAVHWTGGVLSELKSLFGYPISEAHDVSADGEYIVGQVRTEAGPVPAVFNRFISSSYQERTAHARAVLWNAAGEVFDLERLLETQFDLTEELQGWTLTSAHLISDDGRVIVGRGIDPAGETSVWVAVLPIPEPATVVLLLTGLMVATATFARRIPRAKRDRKPLSWFIFRHAGLT